MAKEFTISIENQSCLVRRVVGGLQSGVLFAVYYDERDRFLLLKDGDWKFFGDHDDNEAIAGALEDYIMQS